jgi:hypothetical protein
MEKRYFQSELDELADADDSATGDEMPCPGFYIPSRFPGYGHFS